MKNERRQQLAQNSLASILENAVNNLKDHSATIVRLLLVFLIAVLIFMIWRNFDARNKRDFYNDIKQLTEYDFAVLDTEQFNNVINDYVKKYPSGGNNATVSILIGDIYFNQAADALAKGDRDASITAYETALQYYTIADKFQFKKNQQDLAESAVWGLAQTNIALAALKEGGFFAAAKDSFDRLCKTWPDGTYYELAAGQLEWLDRPVMETFLTKYRQADPVLFAPNLQTPETTSPLGGLDTTITPGDFDIQSFLDNLRQESPDGELPVYDPGFTLPEEQGSQEPQEQSQVTTVEAGLDAVE